MSEGPGSPPGSEQVDARPWTERLDSGVGAIATAMHKALTQGDLAELRRMRPEDPSCGAFWKVVVGHLEPRGMIPDRGPARDGAERRWAAILCGMAHTVGFHDPRRPLGRALAEADYSELRFQRLLRSRGDALEGQVRPLAQYLASKGLSADWGDVARLVLLQHGPAAEGVRRGVARRYYAHGGKENSDA